MRLHLKSIHLKTFDLTCEVCGYQTNSNATFIIHKRIHTGEKPLECKECGTKFNDPSCLISHRKNAHTNSDQEMFCEICGKKFSNLGKLKKHVRRVHESIKVQESIKAREDYSIVEKLKAVRMVESIGTSGTAKTLNIPKGTLKKWVALVKNPKICKICGRNFAYDSSLERHQENAHGARNVLNGESLDDTDNLGVEITNPNQKAPRIRIKNHICEKCSKAFCGPSKLNRHMQSCTGIQIEDKQYKCDNCPKSYASPYTLKYHMQCCTGETAQSPNPITDPGFIQSVIELAKETSVMNTCKVYKLHYATVWGWVRKSGNEHVCEVCQLSCTDTWSLKKHMNTHENNLDGSKIESFNMCKVCSRTFGSRKKLKNHMKSHFPETKLNRSITTLRELYYQKYGNLGGEIQPFELVSTELEEADKMEIKDVKDILMNTQTQYGSSLVDNYEEPELKHENGTKEDAVKQFGEEAGNIGDISKQIEENQESIPCPNLIQDSPPEEELKFVNDLLTY
eukprot:GFUD01030339.1.p1 GENE.GFUD01030339.1~~GFUD01030339.1.p1  ORF type:complete len:510 (+),score=94.65 GFUD01030339.1:1-1530(+)